MNYAKYFYILIPFLIIWSGCHSRNLECQTEDYSGYFIDSTHQPVAGVYVKDILSGEDTFSDSTGYFFIPNEKAPDALLYFYKKGFLNDTIYPLFFIPIQDEYWRLFSGKHDTIRSKKNFLKRDYSCHNSIDAKYFRENR